MATGWTKRELARLTFYAGLGLALGRRVLDGRLTALTGAALLAVLAAIALVCGALAPPIRALSPIAPAQLLAAE
ncbi:hypothetical protein [Streptomyces sp. NPDC054834]